MGGRILGRAPPTFFLLSRRPRTGLQMLCWELSFNFKIGGAVKDARPKRICFLMSVCLSVRPSVLKLDGWNFARRWPDLSSKKWPARLLRCCPEAERVDVKEAKVTNLEMFLPVCLLAMHRSRVGFAFLRVAKSARLLHLFLMHQWRPGHLFMRWMTGLFLLGWRLLEVFIPIRGPRLAPEMYCWQCNPLIDP